MLIESGEGAKKSVTRVALERVSVLQVLSRIIIKTGICDDVFLIVLQDVTVDGGKVNLGTTTTRLEMEDQGRTRDKGFVTIPKMTRNISGTMSGRSEMSLKMAFRLKETSAGLAVSTGMDRGLAIMFVKSMITLEYSAASTTIIMTGLIMFLEVIFVCEVFITILAIVMARALNTMLFQTSPGVKVDVAFIADIMY